jgi:metallo-beta-lactamase class B
MVIGMSLAMVSSGLLGAGKTPDDPLLRPIEPDYAKRWLTPQAPVRVFGNAYLVGFSGLSVGLIQTSAGLILIDGAVPQAVPDVEANIRRLGFSLKQVKYILSTEPHYDHSGGIAALARDTGATVIASVSAAKALRAGRSGPEDPQAALLVPFPAPTRIRTVGDGETIRLGNVVVTAVATPGHTAGSMSWAWRSCEGKRCATIFFASSVNPIASDGYRFLDHRRVVESFRRTFTRLRTVKCGILMTTHPNYFGGDEMVAQLRRNREPNPFIDSKACAAYADRHEALLDERLKKERGNSAQ